MATNRTKRGRGSKRSISPKRSRPRRPARIPTDDRFEIAYTLLREGRSRRRAAQIAGISDNRFGRFLRGNKLANYRNGRWRITDRRVREITIISEGSEYLIKVRGFRPHPWRCAIARRSAPF